MGHWAASWKNLTSFHSTPSMDTAGKQEGDTETQRRGNKKTRKKNTTHKESGGAGASPSLGLPFRMVCCCLAEQMSRLMPSMTWLFESTSFSFGFFPRKMVGTEVRQRQKGKLEMGLSCCTVTRPLTVGLKLFVLWGKMHGTIQNVFVTHAGPLYESNHHSSIYAQIKRHS